jgi:DNA mismatch repair protein MSH4
MKETAFVLDQATRKSLIIIDELGRGTSVADGIGISAAVIEAIQELKAYCLFATHYTEMCFAFHACRARGIVTLTLSSESTQGENAFRIKSGICEQEEYGRDLARKVGFSSEILAIAENIASFRIERGKRTETIEKIVKLSIDLVGLFRSSSLPESLMRQHLADLKIAFEN